ncbi:MAG: hypothetical protein HQK49_00750 [Oligoflexia bacterium]|nr:hypothetical protein [Oligoflexia bacterium]
MLLNFKNKTVSKSCHILMWYLIFCLSITFSSQLFATQIATIISETAIIYADKELTIPIGSVSAKKRVILGDVSTLLSDDDPCPIVVEGKIAYIKRVDVDLNTSKNKNKNKNNIDIRNENLNWSEDDNDNKNYNLNPKSEREVIVKSDPALIYSDRELKVPIGKISKNKQLVIGSKSIVISGGREVYVVILKDKIAYIDRDDLILKDKKDKRIKRKIQDMSLLNSESLSFNGKNIEKITQPLDDFESSELIKKKDIYFGYQYFSNTSMFSFGLELFPKYSYSLILGSDYFFSSSNNSSISALGVNLGTRIRVWRMNYFDIFMIFIGHYFPRYTKRSEYGEYGEYSEYTGNATGISMGSHLLYQINMKIDARLGMNYMMLRVSELTDKNNESDYLQSSNSNSLSIMLTFAYAFSEI